MRKLENRKKYEKSFLPSETEERNARLIVENYAMRGVCPFKYFKASDGAEVVSFLPKDVIVCAIKAAGLWTRAMQFAIDMAQSLDGALFSKNLSHVLCGLKVHDRNGIAPIQSRSNVFPCWCKMGKETKSLVKNEIAPILAQIDHACQVELPQQYGIKAPNCKTHCDMSARWKIMGRGGAMKQKIHACECCAITRDMIDQPNPELCAWCYELGHDKIADYMCFHHEMLTESNIAKLKTQIEVFRNELPTITQNIQVIREKSKIRTAEDPRGTPTVLQKGDINSIYWDIANGERHEKATYGNMLDDDLELRGVDCGDVPIEERQEAMKKKHITKKAMTERMHIKSRTQLDRLLDPENPSVTLLTLEKAANALGKKLQVKLV
jgi:hypothetical protein